MAETTAISWTDATFNPWIGCTKVSPACDHCYAEKLAESRLGIKWGGERRRTAASTWKRPLAWNRKAEREGRRLRVFCASLADVFDNQVPLEWRLELWLLIAKTPHLDWLLLTKRPQNIAKMLPLDWGEGYPNVWLGTTVENQAEAERRIPHLLAVPTRIGFLSCEPLLGPLDLRHACNGHYFFDALAGARWHEPGDGLGALERDIGRIHWVITGGESGPEARPPHPDWFRHLRTQCEAAAVAFHFKQWGEWAPDPCEGLDTLDRVMAAREVMFDGNRALELSGPHLDRPNGEHHVYRIGTKRAGRLLDGVEHNGLPA